MAQQVLPSPLPEGVHALADSTSVDAELVERCLHGERDAFAILFDRHAPRVFALAYHLVGARAEAEDITQDAFVQALGALPSLRQREAFGAWVARIATNVALATLRQRSRLPQAELTEAVTETYADTKRWGSPEAMGLASEDQQSVRLTLNRLAPSHRTALTLREIGGLSYLEIAEALGTTPGGVETLLFRARARFRDEYHKVTLGAITVLPRRCRQTPHVLAAIADDELAAKRRSKAEAHLRDCTDCATTLEEQRDTRRVLALLPIALPSTVKVAMLAKVTPLLASYAGGAAGGAAIGGATGAAGAATTGTAASATATGTAAGGAATSAAGAATGGTAAGGAATAGGVTASSAAGATGSVAGGAAAGTTATSAVTATGTAAATSAATAGGSAAGVAASGGAAATSAIGGAAASAATTSAATVTTSVAVGATTVTGSVAAGATTVVTGSVAAGATTVATGSVAAGATTVATGIAAGASATGGAVAATGSVAAGAAAAGGIVATGAVAGGAAAGGSIAAPILAAVGGAGVVKAAAVVIAGAVIAAVVVAKPLSPPSHHGSASPPRHHGPTRPLPPGPRPRPHSNIVAVMPPHRRPTATATPTVTQTTMLAPAATATQTIPPTSAATPAPTAQSGAHGTGATSGSLPAADSATPAPTLSMPTETATQEAPPAPSATPAATQTPTPTVTPTPEPPATMTPIAPPFATIIVPASPTPTVPVPVATSTPNDTATSQPQPTLPPTVIAGLGSEIGSAIGTTPTMTMTVSAGTDGSITATPTDTPTATDTPSDTSTTNTPSDTPMAPSSDTPTDTSSALATNTPTDAPTPVPTGSPSDTPTNTPTATNTPVPVIQPVAPPGIALSAASGVYGQTITVSGVGFVFGEPVALYWDHAATSPLATAASDALGAVTQSFIVPQAVLGTHTLVAVGQDSGASYSATFTVEPRAGLAHIVRRPGQLNVLKATGFAASETLTAHWGAPDGPLLGTSTANPIGSLNPDSVFTFTVPLSPTGTYTLFVVGAASGASASVSYTLLPLLTDVPYAVTAGGLTTLSGSAFGANETVHLQMYCSVATCPTPTTLGTARTDANGSFTTSVFIPATAPPGRHEIASFGDRSGAFATQTIIVSSP